ncbi:MAG: flavodoxin-dependent (E)-4-hydroxy-3-methylbut-2-enyl-diphosphate synthase [Oscillospiraceae bacterium]|nr:flavodoxin-dependent (E)-4-hydroxy-3-methylbut-2-enyl-diphosphate synthase [Oscillospiraceae bacterium]
MMERRKTKKIKIGSIYIGGDAPITVQSMTRVRGVAANIAQILELEAAGCEIIRVAVLGLEDAKAIYKIKEQINIPLVADIHFNHKLAIESVYAGADKIRINPGNIGDNSRVKEVVTACKLHGVPIRVGVNGGSAKCGLFESAVNHVRILESFDFDQIVVAIKSSNVYETIQATRMFSQAFDYPLHLGVTETGTQHMGTIKSAIGIGSLLCDGIGDTIRVSLTASPIEEVKEGIAILKAAGVRKSGLNIISCPTCGRTMIDLINLTTEFERRAVTEITNDHALTVAIMGCAVNGPGEASDADIGVAGGKGNAVLFKHGKVVRKIREDEIIQTLIDEINRG